MGLAVAVARALRRPDRPARYALAHLAVALTIAACLLLPPEDR